MCQYNAFDRKSPPIDLNTPSHIVNIHFCCCSRSSSSVFHKFATSMIYVSSTNMNLDITITVYDKDTEYTPKSTSLVMVSRIALIVT